MKEHRQLAKEVITKYKKAGLTIATAESCTGGLVSSILTDISGSSAVLMGGIVSYSNEAKMKLLGVSEDTLEEFGAVSAQTAHEMANGARSVFKVDVAVSITGVAGPTGGTGEKPVGLVFIGLANRKGVQVVRFQWKLDRIGNKEASTKATLEFLLEQVK